LPPVVEAVTGRSDADLIAALPDAIGSAGRPITAEVGRRRLVGAISGLEAVCRRFKGFGLESRVAEQADALQALSAIGGRDAAAAVSRLISGTVVQGPNLVVAMTVAVTLGCQLPADTARALLQHADPATRAAAARCAPAHPSIVPVVIALLDDLHPAVVLAAVRTLGQWGRGEARPALLRLLDTDPTEDLIAAAVGVADEAIIVALSRIGRVRLELTGAVLDALREIDDPRAAVVLARFGSAGEL
jgi:HEAT repeat protein